MGIFNFIFRLLNGSISSKPSRSSKPSKQQNMRSLNELVSANGDVIEGMIFHPTLQLRTPLSVLKKSGEVHKGKGKPPIYCEEKHGIWLPKLSSDFDLFDVGATSASDAGPVDEKQYLEYAIGLLTIFDSTASIYDKMDLAICYSNKSKNLKIIEKKICSYYSETDIRNVMIRFIPKEDSLRYCFQKTGYLYLIKSINTKVISALESEQIFTIEQLLPLSESDFLKIKGIGKVTASKLSAELEEIKRILI